MRPAWRKRAALAALALGVPAVLLPLVRDLPRAQPVTLRFPAERFPRTLRLQWSEAPDAVPSGGLEVRIPANASHVFVEPRIADGPWWLSVDLSGELPSGSLAHATRVTLDGAPRTVRLGHAPEP